MLSRAANSLFWMSRYVERAESVARFIEVNRALTLTSLPDREKQWAPIVYASGDEKLFREKYAEFLPENVLPFLTFDADNPNSILSCVMKARENARAIREHLPSALWEELNTFYHRVCRASERSRLSSTDEFYQTVKRASQAVVGILYGTMSHGEGWHFCRMARLLERADKTSRILDVKYYTLLPQVSDVGQTLDVVQWSALLASNSALQMYRRRYGQIAPESVVRFLVLDRSFPRAIHFCLLGAEESLNRITGSNSGTFQNRAEQLLGQLRARLSFITVEDVIRDGLHEFIDQFQKDLNEVSIAISGCFFEPRTDIDSGDGISGMSQTQQMNH